MGQKLILTLLLILMLPGIVGAHDVAPQIAVFPVSHLSALDNSEVLVAVLDAGAGPGEILTTLTTRDGKVRLDASLTPVTLGPGHSLVRVHIPATTLAPFTLGEELTLTVRLSVPGGPPVEDTQTVRLLAQPAVAADGSWAMAVAHKPAQVVTNGLTLLKYVIYNPKNNPKNANVIVKFLGDEGKVKSKCKVALQLQPGLNQSMVAIPSSVTSEARLQGATLLKSSLKRDTTAVAKDQALLDFDLNTTAGAAPVLGSRPLTVSFTASTTGGQLPYVYSWTFGDGSSAGGQSTTHIYTLPGQFTATLTVTDGLGAIVTSDVLVTVVP
jgi:hypothetical protein